MDLAKSKGGVGVRCPDSEYNLISNLIYLRSGVTVQGVGEAELRKKLAIW